MYKKHTLALGMLASLVLLFISTRFYPGGSQHDPNTVGFDWQYNYLSNLFAEQAINGQHNAARIWVIPGMVLLCATFALFFVTHSKKIPSKSASNVIKYSGAGAMVFSFFTVTPYHDLMIIIGVTLALLSVFYITVFVLMSRLRFLKLFSVVVLVIPYVCNYMYFTRSYLEYLPLMQKATLLAAMTWMLSLHYVTSEADFQSRSKKNSSEA